MPETSGTNCKKCTCPPLGLLPTLDECDCYCHEIPRMIRGTR